MMAHDETFRWAPSARACVSMLVLILALAAALVVDCSTVDDHSQTDDLVVVSTFAAQDDVPPVANAGGNLTAYVGFPAVLNGSLSEDNIGITSYDWTFVDGANVSLTGEVVEHVFNTPGNYTVTLNVTDAEGNWDVDSILVTVVEDLTPPDSAPGYDTIEFVGREFELDGSGSEDTETGIVSWVWTISKDDILLQTLDGEIAYYTFEEPGNYTVTLTVTNGVGVSASESIIVTVGQEPSWLSENWGGVLVAGIIAGVIAVLITRRWFKNHALLTSAEREKMRLRYKEFKRIWGLLKANRLGFAGFLVLCIFIGMAILAPAIATVKDPSASRNQETAADYVNSPPSFSPSPYTGFIHPLGTDVIGQDVYSLTVYGARASLMVGLVATLISVILGVTVGLFSGFYGKGVDEILMRFTDYFLVLPWFPLMIVLMTVLGQEFIWVIIVIGITSWPSTARIVRSQVLTVKERAFIERARAIGAGDMHIIRIHVFPNVLPLVFANTVLLISLAIFSEAFLDFFGLGDPDVISWGTMLELAYNFGAFDSESWWWVLPPSLSIILCVLAFSLVGYALDDIFNPKLRRR